MAYNFTLLRHGMVTVGVNASQGLHLQAMSQETNQIAYKKPDILSNKLKKILRFVFYKVVPIESFIAIQKQLNQIQSVLAKKICTDFTISLRIIKVKFCLRLQNHVT